MKAVLWVLLVFVQIREHKGCLEEERIGLLDLKAFLKSKTSYSTLLLPSWVDDTESECCGWERVMCNSTTGQVIELSLNKMFYHFEDYVLLVPWLLNASLLEPFKELRSLDLSLNQIRCWMANEEWKGLSKLSTLKHLNLSGNFIEEEIVRFLGALQALQSLDLSRNHIIMEGRHFLKELAKLSNLEVLILGDNGLHGLLPLQELANFRRLEILDMSSNSFTGNISSYIGALSSLKAISLSGNYELNGTLPTQDLCSLKNLEELDLANNNFEGILPPCLNNMTSLRLLDISGNHFTGKISSLIANSTSLEYIDLTHNRFEDLFSFSLLANHSKLEVIRFTSENNRLEIETENPMGWHPLFQLKDLALSNCNLNKLTGNIPKFLYEQHKLEGVDLSHNKLKGSFPIWLLENNTRLRMLDLRNNSLMGQFHLPPDQHVNISWMDVSDNHFDGQLQENIGKISPYLEYLNLSRNLFEGILPSSIGDMSLLKVLDLCFNNFSGEVPTELAANCTFLKVLKLCNNSFRGAIFSGHFRLWELDISNNYMSGTIPRLMGNMTRETLGGALIMSNNFFEGQIPCELNSPSLIDLSHNSFSGPLCLHLGGVEHLLLQGNKLTGSIPKAVFDSSSLLTLNIRDNSFFGSIPDEIGALSNLKILLLRGNNFSGMIPNQLCALEKIIIMDLSKNTFSGTIPNCLQNITFGKRFYMNLGYSSYVSRNSSLIKVVSYTYESLLDREIGNADIYVDEKVGVEFTTKYRSISYNGGILNYMSGLDFSCNKLTGGIPMELGQLSSIHVLNLSYNQLTDSIPETFSNLTLLESLDLSHNSLSGEIPSILIDLSFLEVFNVAHNNLSGRVPEMKAQFATFDNSSYEGNPFLCGPPLEKSCTIVESHPKPTKASNVSGRKWYEVDPFYTTFSVSYIIFFLGVVSILYVNPYWRQRCFSLIEDLMFRCYYFVFDTLRGVKPS